MSTIVIIGIRGALDERPYYEWVHEGQSDKDTDLVALLERHPDATVGEFANRTWSKQIRGMK